MLFALSWRNVWRNKTRSGVMITAIALGICAGIFTSAFYNGMADQRIEKAINTEIGHMQIHKEGFRQSNDLIDFMPDAETLAHSIGKDPNVIGTSSRLVVFSMVASAETASGVKIVGVEPENERMTTNLHEKLVEGDYFESKRRNPILLGQKLVDKLNIKLGSKVVITVQDIDNNITAGAFRVVGIFNTINNGFDEGQVFVRKNDLRRLMNLPEGAGHEIAVLMNDIENIPALQARLTTETDYEVMNWREISPEMNYLSESMDLFLYIFIVIILFALLFGIINTMLMAVLERTKEIGMLMAVGMNRIRVFVMIMIESIWLSIVGGILGVGIGALIAKYYETHAIDLSIWSEVYTEIGYDPFVYTNLDINLLINVTLLVLLTGMLASVYPAIKALQNDPADALRTE